MGAIMSKDSEAQKRRSAQLMSELSHGRTRQRRTVVSDEWEPLFAT
jgi:hypothetical protein